MPRWSQAGTIARELLAGERRPQMWPGCPLDMKRSKPTLLETAQICSSVFDK
jgi:hypothetical protein